MLKNIVLASVLATVAACSANSVSETTRFGADADCRSADGAFVAYFDAQPKQLRILQAQGTKMILISPVGQLQANGTIVSESPQQENTVLYSAPGWAAKAQQNGKTLNVTLGNGDRATLKCK